MTFSRWEGASCPPPLAVRILELPLGKVGPLRTKSRQRLDDARAGQRKETSILLGCATRCCSSLARATTPWSMRDFPSRRRGDQRLVSEGDPLQLVGGTARRDEVEAPSLRELLMSSTGRDLNCERKGTVLHLFSSTISRAHAKGAPEFGLSPRAVRSWSADVTSSGGRALRDVFKHPSPRAAKALARRRHRGRRTNVVRRVLPSTWVSMSSLPRTFPMLCTQLRMALWKIPWWFATSRWRKPSK